MYPSPNSDYENMFGTTKKVKYQALGDFVYNLFYLVIWLSIAVFILIVGSTNQANNEIRKTNMKSAQIETLEQATERIGTNMKSFTDKLEEGTLTEEEKNANPYDIMGVPTIQGELKKIGSKIGL